MPNAHLDRDRIALGVRQPWVELILRGIKTIEVRSQNTQQRGTIYLYASKKLSDLPGCEDLARQNGFDLDVMPRGMVVGTVDLVSSEPCRSRDATAACVSRSYLDGHFSWRLENPQRLAEPASVKHVPYGIWFYPWKRRPKP